MSRSWLPSGWKIGSRLRRLRLPRAEVLVLLGAALVALVISLSIVASSSAARSRRAAEMAQQERLRQKKTPAFTLEDLALGPEDFLLPSLQGPSLEPRYAPFRPRLSRWSAEQASKYWVSPRDIATEMVQSMNDRAIERLFHDVP